MASAFRPTNVIMLACHYYPFVASAHRRTGHLCRGLGCQLGNAEPLCELLEHCSRGPEEEEGEDKGEVSVFTVHQYEQLACVPLGMDNTCTLCSEQMSQWNYIKKS